MKVLSIKKGDAVYIKTKRYEVINAVNFREVLLKDTESGQTGLYALQQLRATPEGKVKQGNSQTPFEHIPEHRQEEIDLKNEIIKPLLKPDRTRKEVVKRALEFGRHPSTLYRWIGKVETEGTRSSLNPKYEERGGKGVKKLDSAVEAVICAKDFSLLPNEISGERVW